MATNDTLLALRARRQGLQADYDRHAAALATIKKELDELDTAERVVGKLNVQATLFNTPAAAAPSVVVGATNGHADTKPTTPKMILEVIRSGHGGSAAKIIDAMGKRWSFSPDPNVVRPTLWRMANKDRRLRKVGDGYEIA
jgi:hypothetical protein